MDIKYEASGALKTATMVSTGDRYVVLFIFIGFLLIGLVAVPLLALPVILGLFTETTNILLLFAFFYGLGGFFVLLMWTLSLKATLNRDTDTLELTTNVFLRRLSPIVIKNASSCQFKPVAQAQGILDKGRSFELYLSKNDSGLGIPFSVKYFEFGSRGRRSGLLFSESEVVALSDFFGIPIGKAKEFDFASIRVAGIPIYQKESEKEFEISRERAEADSKKLTYTTKGVAAAALGFISFTPCLGVFFTIPAILLAAWAILELRSNKNAEAVAYLLPVFGIGTGLISLVFYGSSIFLMLPSFLSPGNYTTNMSAYNTSFDCENRAYAGCFEYTDCSAVTEMVQRDYGYNLTYVRNYDGTCSNSSNICCTIEGEFRN